MFHFVVSRRTNRCNREDTVFTADIFSKTDAFPLPLLLLSPLSWWQRLFLLLFIATAIFVPDFVCLDNNICSCPCSANSVQALILYSAASTPIAAFPLTSFVLLPQLMVMLLHVPSAVTLSYVCINLISSFAQTKHICRKLGMWQRGGRFFCASFCFLIWVPCV